MLPAPLKQIAVGLALAAFAAAGWADEPPARAAQPLPPAFKRGPLAIPLGGQATLKLPAGFAFLPAAETRSVLREWGNRPTDRTLGMVLPISDDAAPAWFLILAYFPEGFIRDDDAKEWNSDVLLAEIRRHLEPSNEARRAEGDPETELAGWVAPPRYDDFAHRLTWSVAISEGRAPVAPGPRPTSAATPPGPASPPVELSPEAPQSINLSTVILGRSGYLSASLVMPLGAYSIYAESIQSIVTAISFDLGRRYVDFNSKTDPVADRGLSSLVAANPSTTRSWLERLLAAKREISYVAIASLFGMAFGLLLRGRRRS